ncbi:MAG: SEL1-like repeat protein [Metallibacterium sp.]
MIGRFMHRVRRALLAIALAGLAVAAVAAPPARAATDTMTAANHAAKALRDADQFALISGRGSAHACQAGFESLRHAALQGKASDQLLFGALYLHGRDCGSFHLARDDDKAVLYLEHAAIQGRLLAMPALAELEVRRGHALEANVWALAYLHYAVPAQQDTGYPASLLHRTLGMLSKTQNKQVLADANAFILRYNAGIEAGLYRQMLTSARKPTACRLRPVDAHHRVHLPQPFSQIRIRPMQRALVLYLVAFGRDGRVHKLAPVFAVPQWRDARRLRTISGYRRVQPAPACGQALRWALLPVELDNHHYRISGRTGHS